MNGLNVFTSNSLESLAVQLCGKLHSRRSAQRPALEPDRVMVQSRGMARWVSFRMATLSGICMNCQFPFPRTIVEESLRVFFPEMSDPAHFSVEVMSWRILKLLPQFARSKAFAPVNHYLAAGDALKAFQLASRVARLFDQYLVYRPAMLTEWESAGDGENWQAILWNALLADTREVCGTGATLHFAAILNQLSERMAVAPAPGRLASRLAIFGISSLPPAYLRSFFELSRHCEINLFCLHPSQEYFAHDLAPKRRAKLQAGNLAELDLITGEDAGHPLLASLGKLNRDQIELRIDFNERAGFVIREEQETFLPRRGSGMLAVLQDDILHARNRCGSTAHIVSADDRSIELHACHSPTRELETLYDYLLGRFEADPTLSPRDILVMTPDIEKYAPFIHSVFAYPEVPARLIPFSVADRGPLSSSPTVETFSALLGLAGSRCAAADIYSILERAPIRRRFAFSDEDLLTIRRWISDTGIRWGIDGAHRCGFDVPEMAANTWRAGLDRLLLGFAMAGENHQLFEGILPHDEVEGTGAEVLGRFISAVEAIFELCTGLPKARALQQWPEVLGKIVDSFFLADGREEVAGLQVIRTALEQLGKATRLAGNGQEVEFRVVRQHLSGLLEAGSPRGGFLTGGVTFCAMQPMRSIPARVICLIGMDDQAFPRPSHPLEFDLMALAPECGDRSPRDDERYLFLELLVSAQDRLFASYVGRSAIDNVESPPSVLISELLDCLDRSMVFPQKQSARGFLLREHRLHAFSPVYFDGRHPGLASYSQANAAASRAVHTQQPESAPEFFAKALPRGGPQTQRIELASVVEFFANPAGDLMRKRLGIRLEETDDCLAPNEPFALNALQQYRLKEELLAWAIEQREPDPRAWNARGVLPLGEIGASALRRLRREVNHFHKRLAPELGGHRRATSTLIDVPLGKFSLTGTLDCLYGQKSVHFRCAGLKAKDRLKAWIHHLARCAAAPREAVETLVIATDGSLRFSTLIAPGALLEALVTIYQDGQTRPLPFFPEISWAYAHATLYPSPRAKNPPLHNARRAWHGNGFGAAPHKDEPYNAFCFREEPLGWEFQDLSLAVFQPLLENQASQ